MSAARFPDRVSHFVSKRPIWLAEAADRDRPVADHPAHRRVAAQPIGVIQILIAGEPPEYRLPQQPDQEVLSVLTGACIR